MNEGRYNVVFRGQLLPGTDLDTATSRLMAVFAISEQKARQILAGKRVVLKKEADEVMARHFGQRLKRAGLDVVLVRCTPPEPPPPPPADDTGQPASSLPSTEPAPVSVAPRAAPEKPLQEALPFRKKQIPFAFQGSGPAYFKLWIVNTILSILTLGIYSAWAKVRTKKYLYTSLRLMGDGFAYHAKPIQIFKGRLVVFTIILITSILSNLIPLVAPVFSLAFVVVMPWIVVKALAFNAHNSSFRNIRFGFQAKVREAASVFILWPALSVLTLGCLFPAAYYRQKKFIIENTTYGTTRFAFAAASRDYYRIFIKAGIWVLLAVLVAAALVLAGVALGPLPQLTMVFYLTAPVAGLAVYLYLFAYFSVKTTNLFYSAVNVAEHGFHADLKVNDMLGLVATNSLAIAVTLGLFYPWAKIRSLRYTANHLRLIADGPLDTFIAGEKTKVGALADEMGGFMDLDLGL